MQLKLLYFYERFFLRNMKSVSLQIFSFWCVRLEHWKSIPKYRQLLNIQCFGFQIFWGFLFQIALPPGTVHAP